jgi:outer membrane protein assembly factor BamB
MQCVTSWSLLRHALALMLLAAIVAPQARGEIVTQDADALRSGWYPNEPALSAQAVASDSFGRIFDHRIEGQVYAQPLVANGILLVATNSDWLYGFDADTGDLLWQRSVGPPLLSSDGPEGGICPNPSPHIGVLGTPVIDADTNTAYMIAKGYVSGDPRSRGPSRFQLHAVDLASGGERAGFPVTIEGTAQNLPGLAFDPHFHLQRPGLLLMDGVIYAGFGGICDMSPYYGWLAAISTSGAKQGMWVASTAGASLWQSGGALVSDGPGQILFTTGNSSTFDGGGAPMPGPGRQPPATLGQAVVRVRAEPDGRMQATDFFSPWNNLELDQLDYDLGSSAPMALPEQWFGTPSVPRLLLQDGKEGMLYLLNRDELGGMSQGPGGEDAVVQKLGPRSGVWDAMASWPGDGGFVYVTAVFREVTGLGELDVYAYGEEGGEPRLSLAASSDDHFGYGSGGPVVTSDGIESGSGIVWGTRCPTGRCLDAELRAYGATPVDGHLQLLWRSPIGVANKFTAPGVGDGRIYVGTRDGHIMGYGTPAAALVGADVSFGTVVVGLTSTRQATFTAHEDMTITGIAVDGANFGIDLSSTRLPAALQAGDSIAVPTTYAPAARGRAAGTLTFATSRGTRAYRLSGDSVRAELKPSRSFIAFHRLLIGATSTAPVTLINEGDIPLTVAAVTPLAAPFSVSGAPDPGTVLQRGEHMDLQVTFDPTAPGDYSGAVEVQTEAGTTAIPLSGAAFETPVTVSPLAFPVTIVGQSEHRSVTFTARRDITVNSLSGVDAPFAVGDSSRTLPVTLRAGESFTADVSFTPDAVGPVEGRLTVVTSEFASQLDLTGTGGTAALDASSAAVDLGRVAVGGTAHAAVTFTSRGDALLKLASVRLPAAPFGARGVPADGTVVEPGGTFTVTLDFAPSAEGPFTDRLELRTTAGLFDVLLSGTATAAASLLAPPPLRPVRRVRMALQQLRISPTAIVLGSRRAAVLRYRLSVPAAVALAIERRLPHHRCGGRADRCSRWKPLAWRRTLDGRAGPNSARLELASLGVGRYRLLATPASAAATGVARSIPFLVVAGRTANGRRSRGGRVA